MAPVDLHELMAHINLLYNCGSDWNDFPYSHVIRANRDAFCSTLPTRTLVIPGMSVRLLKKILVGLGLRRVKNFAQRKSLSKQKRRIPNFSTMT